MVAFMGPSLERPEKLGISDNVSIYDMRALAISQMGYK